MLRLWLITAVLAVPLLATACSPGMRMGGTAAQSAPFDQQFIDMMVPHHEGAVEMAKVALKHARDPETKRMAQKIIDDQEKEIAEMRDWLKKYGK